MKGSVAKTGKSFKNRVDYILKDGELLYYTKNK